MPLVLGLAFRRCGEKGLWLGKHPDEMNPAGWTNYTPCFPAEVQALFFKVYENEKVAQEKFEIALNTRYLEIFGFTISMVALLISLVIFTVNRSLRNSRTQIHKCLFSAMVLQLVIRLVVYIDQALARSRLDESANNIVDKKGIENVPYLCETSYVLLENAITVMFMWMFIEGMYLHNLVTGNTLRPRRCFLLYSLIGWGIPLVTTLIWAGFTALHYKNEAIVTCWYGYNFLPYYWIVQGPRLAAIVINFLFLVDIMRVLIVKLRQTKSTEMEKLRKAVRAALVLLPLLGITNIMNMIEVSVESSPWKFALWSYTTYFLRSFQGFFIALIYCFLNAEVRAVLKKQYRDYMAMRSKPRLPRKPFSFCPFGKRYAKKNEIAYQCSHLDPLKIDEAWFRMAHSVLPLHNPRYEGNNSDSDSGPKSCPAAIMRDYDSMDDIPDLPDSFILAEMNIERYTYW